MRSELETSSEDANRLNWEISNLVLSFTRRDAKGPIISGVEAEAGKKVPKGSVAEQQFPPIAT